MNRRESLAACICLCWASVFAQIPEGTGQLVAVLSPDWGSPEGTLCLWERGENGWAGSWEGCPVNLGSNGLGWGLGLHESSQKGPVKKEGDRRAPAGLFYFEPRLYGYAPEAPPGVSLPYTSLTSDWVGVDDPASVHYNRVLDRSKVEVDWNSHERMRRDDNLYSWVLVVEHNADPVVPGAGSCIFFHVWRGPGRSTAGCTSMAEENLLKLAGWLRAEKRPVLLQVPASVYRELAEPWGLPALAE